MTGEAATAGPGGASPEDGTVEVSNPAGTGDFVVVCEHASNAIPAEFAGLGLDAGALASHIAWDPGALPVARRMAEVLDAALVAQRVSRLLYDCNRPPEAASAVPEASEVYAVPGNTELSPAQRAERAARFYEPFRTALARLLDARLAEGRPPTLVTMHTFTPVYHGVRRDTGLGILHDRDRRLADALLDAAKGREGLTVHRNKPYGPKDGVTHTLAAQALPRGLLNAMIEIRNDLVADADAQREMADWLAGCVRAARDRVTGGRAIA